MEIVSIEKKTFEMMVAAFGDRFCKVTPDSADDRKAFLNEQARIVAKVNAPEGTDIAQLVRKTQGGLRRVYTEIEKLKRQ